MNGKIKTVYWSLVGTVSALLVSTQAVYAADMWDRFSAIMKDIYGEIVAISTIVAVTVAAIALLVRIQSDDPSVPVVVPYGRFTVAASYHECLVPSKLCDLGWPIHRYRRHIVQRTRHGISMAVLCGSIFENGAEI